MMFSARTNWSGPNAWATAVAARRAAGLPLLDLTVSNPTQCGFDYSQAGLESLSDPAGRLYQPAPRGLPEARAAVAAYYATHGIAVDPQSVILTASTSEAYSYLFKLLADPGDRMLAPVPSYPLFEHLARLDGLDLLPYPLAYDGTWHLDFAALEALPLERARALIVVHPHNPTGAFLKRDERDRLLAFCRRHDLALICDEVFLDYAYRPDPERAGSLADTTGVLAFTLSGLSKVAGLPQVKASWIVVTGPPTLQASALARAEILADTYLSVSTAVQVALPRLLGAAPYLASQIAARVATNRKTLAAALGAPRPLDVLAAEGGWYALLRLPAIESEETWLLALLEDGLLVHPGYFFDFPFGPLLVLSLLPPPALFAEGIASLIRRVESVINESSTP